MTVNMQGSDLAVSIGGVYYFADPSSMETFDRKRQRAEQATGSRNSTVDWYDGDSEVKCNVKKNLSDGDAALLPIIGAGATIGLPTSTSIIYAQPNRTLTVANCLCNDFTISGERGKPFELDMNFLSTSIPVLSAGYGGSRPSFGAPGNYLYWRDLLSFFSAAAASSNCQKFSLKVDHQLDGFPGVRADGFTIPTVYTPTDIYVTGGFTMQMLGSADYALFLAACDTAADLGLTGKAFCNGATLVLTLTAKLAVYETQKRESSQKKTTMESFTFVSKALGGVNQAVITIA